MNIGQFSYTPSYQCDWGTIKKNKQKTWDSNLTSPPLNLGNVIGSYNILTIIGEEFKVWNHLVILLENSICKSFVGILLQDPLPLLDNSLSQ